MVSSKTPTKLLWSPDLFLRAEDIDEQRRGDHSQLIQVFVISDSSNKGQTGSVELRATLPRTEPEVAPNLQLVYLPTHVVWIGMLGQVLIPLVKVTCSKADNRRDSKRSKVIFEQYSRLQT